MGLLLLIATASCSGGGNQALFEKRKHRSGFHLSWKQGVKNNPSTSSNEAMANATAMGIQEIQAPQLLPVKWGEGSPVALAPRAANNWIGAVQSSEAATTGAGNSADQSSHQGWIGNGAYDVLLASQPVIPPTENPEEEEPKVHRYTIGSMAVSLSTLNLIILMWIPVIGLLSGILGMVLSKKARDKEDRPNRIMGLIGMCVSGFTIFISSLMVLLLIVSNDLFPV